MIPFLSLPYLFQERFIEIATDEIFTNFLEVSSSTKKLCKKRKIVQNLEYSPSITVPKEFENLMQINDLQNLKKFINLKIINDFIISPCSYPDNSQKPYKFDDFKMIPRTYKRLDFVNVFFENISDITNLIGPNLVNFTFLPKIMSLEFSPKWEKELNDLFAALDKIEDVRFMLGFNRDETPEEFKKIDGIIQKWRSQRNHESRYSYWHVTLKHGLNGTLGKNYHKINKITPMGSGKTCYNCNDEREKHRFKNIVHRVFISKDL